jgi:outer membrane protein
MMRKLIVLLMGLSLSAVMCNPLMAADPAATVTKTPAGIAAPPAIATPEGGTPPYGPRLSPAATPSVVTMGFVDMAKIASDSVPGKAAAAEMKSRSNRLRNQISAREKQLSKQKADIEATLPKEFQKKIEAFQKFVQKGGKDIQAREGQLLSRLYQSTQKAAEQLARANGYAAVVIKKELLYMSDTVDMRDLTDETIKLLNTTPSVKK